MKKTIQLGGKNFPLQMPSGLRRLDVVTSYPGNDSPMPMRIRWAFGVLGLCWADKALGWPTPAALKHDLIAFGESVYDGLDNAGLNPGAAGPAVFEAAAETLAACQPTSEQVQGAKDFG